MNRWAACVHGLGRALLPARCLVCGERGADPQDLCADCRAGLPWNRIACPRCALPVADPSCACGACQLSPPPQSLTRAALLYGCPIDRLLPRFKFHADLAAGRLLSELMLEGLAGVERPQAVVPLPLHRSRLRERGYDQALELARPIALALALPLAPTLLRRQRHTPPQSELDAQARRSNLHGAFFAPATSLRHVALVDDVMTTGATLQAATRALQHAGVARVDAWVCARVP